MKRTHDIAIVGGGIVGLATAYELLRRSPELRVVLLEKESRLAAHQTSHNSGVVHSGLYYEPGSLKARLSREGGRLLDEFCTEEGIRLHRCGKIVVATEQSEIGRLEELHRRGVANGLNGVERIGPEQIREIEPEVTRAIAGIRVPEAGVVDYTSVAERLGERIREAGGEVRPGFGVVEIEEADDGLRLSNGREAVTATFLIACAGLQADRVARLQKGSLEQQIVPFRGEYHELRQERRGLVIGLIYPVPDPRFPFLGVHLTRTIDGRILIGPNAVLAFHREGYTRGRVSVRDLIGSLTFGGFWRMAVRHWRTGLSETWRSLATGRLVEDVRRLVPAVNREDLVPYRAGVRAQAVDRDGALLDDFRLVDRQRAVHVINAPSPAATSCLAIARELVDRACERFPALSGDRAVGAGEAKGPAAGRRQ